MMKIAIAGATGRMGKILIEAVLNISDAQLVGALDHFSCLQLGKDAGAFLGKKTSVFITADIPKVLRNADFLIDFTTPEGTMAHLAVAEKTGTKMIIGTTGLSPEQIDILKHASAKLAIVFAPNMSVGMNVTFKLLEIAAKICSQPLAVRQAVYVHFRASEGQLIDQGIALYFKAPHSFTAEDVVELQCHGGPVIVDYLLETVLAHGARMAQPGEFSERAFLNDKIDLIQAEAVADLIASSTRRSAEAALRSLDGEFSRKIKHLVDELIHLRTFIEATLDFPEEDIEMIENARVREALALILMECDHLQSAAHSGVLLQEGVHLVLIGPPNAGKSSLMNHLACQDVAIVSDIPGTTRDVLKEKISLRGIPLYLLDTAGLRQSTDAIEGEGIRRTERAMHQAECMVLLIDDRHPEDLQRLLQEYKELLQGRPLLVLFNKIDLTGKQAERIADIVLPGGGACPALQISIKMAQGLDLLTETLLELCGWVGEREGQFSARRRHLDALKRAHAALKQGLAQYQQTQSLELLAEECRLAQEALSEITGEFRADDLLGAIFSTFCIGK